MKSHFCETCERKVRPCKDGDVAFCLMPRLRSNSTETMPCSEKKNLVNKEKVVSLQNNIIIIS